MQIIVPAGAAFRPKRMAPYIINSSLAFNERFFVDLKCLHGYQIPSFYAVWRLTQQPGVLENVIYR